MDRFSEYRIMWLLVFFDLPTDTKKERKAASDFRKRLDDPLPVDVVADHGRQP